MAADRRFEPWPFICAGMLASMICASLAFYAVAAANIDAEVVDDPYQAGLAYNDELAENRRATELGLSVALETQRTPEGVEVVARLLGADGAPVASDAAVVRRERPTQGGFDADFALEPVDGAWRGAIPLPLPGRWHLAATVDVDGQPVRRDFRVWHRP